METNKKITRTNIADHLLDYQLNMIGKTRLDVVDDDKWFFNFTMTKEQLAEFKEYAVPLMQKVFKFNKTKAENSFNWFREQFGVRIKN